MISGATDCIFILILYSLQSPGSRAVDFDIIGALSGQLDFDIGGNRSIGVGTKLSALRVTTDFPVRKAQDSPGPGALQIPGAGTNIVFSPPRHRQA